ncbi:MAG: hypothetical protein ABIY55_07115, partial [Kofleriaceae bacterium]
KKKYTTEFIRTTIKEKKLDGLSIFSQLKSDLIETLEFLKECSFLQKLSLYCIIEPDFSFLEKLQELKYLSVGASATENNIIKLSNQINLEDIAFAQRAVDHNPLPDNTAGFAATLARAQARTRATPEVLPPPGTFREPVFHLLEASDFAAAAGLANDPSWRVRRAALAATRFRFTSENDVEVTPRARAAATAMLGDTAGVADREAVRARDLALAIREQAYFARDPVPRLGDRMTRDAFYQALRARGSVVLGEAEPPAPRFVDRVVVPGGRLERVSDYVSLLRDLAALPPREALAQFDLDDAAYLEVARSWGAAIDADPTIAPAIAAGLAKR